MTRENKQINKSTLNNWFFYTLLIVFSTSTFYAMGMRRGVVASVLTIFISLLLAHRASGIFFIFYAFIFFLVALFCLPNTMTYGQLSFGMVVSIMETNTNETYEYLTNMPINNILLSVAYIILFVLLLYSYHFGRLPRRIVIKTPILVLLFVIGIVYSPISKFLDKDVKPDKKADYSYLISHSFYPPVSLGFATYRYLRVYKAEKEKLLNARNIPSTWEIVSVQPKYKNYLVVIGESARKDYQSLYGYPIRTSPFMDTVNATIFNHYISPAAHTVTSLKRMLIQNDKNTFSYTNNVITLAKKAGFDTYWLSNQGYIGSFDTETSIIALNAKKTFFTKKLEYAAKPIPDLALLPELEKIIQQKSQKPKIIFMHTMGSHSRFCRRLDDSYQVKPITGIINKKMSCYLTSLLQTDKLIEKSYSILKNSKEPFSIMYFSDHGQTHTHKGESDTSLIHGEKYKQAYDIPMIVMSSDDKNRKFIDAKKSGFDFIRQFSEWTGIKVKSIDNKSRFFTEYQPEKIQIFSETLKNYEQLEDDPAVLP